MTTRKIGIEVEAKATGDGLRKTERQAKELDEMLERLDKRFQSSSVGRFTDELKEARTRSRQWVDILGELADEMERANRETHDYRKQTEKVKDSVEEAFRAQDRAIEKTEKLTRATAEGGREAFDYFTRYSKVITTLNQGRFHTVEMAKALGLLNNQTSQGSREWHQYGAQSEQIRQTFRELDTTLHTLNLSIKNLTENLEKSERRMNQGEIAVDALGTELQDTGDRAYYLNEALFESQTQLHIWETRAAAAEFKAQALGAEMREIARDTDKFDEELTELRRSVDRVDDKLDQMGRSVNQVDDSLDKSRVTSEAWGETFGNIVSNVLEEAAQAAWQFAQDSVAAFYEFDRGTREIFTLLPGASTEMKEALKADALELGIELGRLPEEMLPAIYAALSAGIPESNVLDAVATASEAARAGVSDLDTTLKLGVAILNAQVGGVENLDQVYDQLFFTIKNGVVTMPELTNGFNAVTSIAGEAGVSLQDISAALVVMTRQGDSAQEAFELLSIMLTQLSTSGTTLASTFQEAAGKSFRQFIAEGGNLAGAMELLQSHAADTGQALGDILGGGSPFFRDTQAARGVLELTGKHLDDLVHFSNEANETLGDMSQASLEMGQSAEFGALQAAAAWDEMKISMGEAYSQEASFIEQSKQGIAEYVTEDAKRRTQILATRDALKEMGLSGLELNHTISAITTGSMLWRGSMVEAETMAYRTEIALRLLEDGFDGTGAELEELINQEIKQIEAAKEMGESLASVDAKLMNFNSGLVQTKEIVPPTVATLREASEAALDLSNSLATYGDEDIGTGFTQAVLDAKEEMIAANTEITATAEDRANRIAAAAAAEREALLQSRQEFNEYALRIAHGGEATANWTNELFINAAQQGVNAEQLHLLAIATGEYSEEQIQAMLTEAAMSQAVDRLSEKLVNGEISTRDAITALQDYEQALANDFEANINFDDFINAEEQARQTKEAFLAAQGEYSAKFTTHNVTVNETVTKTTSQGDATALHEGGHFRAGELLLVGDAPGGKFIPGISEFVVFDQPGQVIGAADSARLFAGQGLPPGFNDGQPALGSTSNPAEGRAPVQITINLYEAPNRDIEDNLLRALQRGGLTN